jgi:hypothetical protein
MKIETLWNSDLGRLTDEINTFLNDTGERYKYFELIDIKFQVTTAVRENEDGMNLCYFAMIIYKL